MKNNELSVFAQEIMHLLPALHKGLFKGHKSVLEKGTISIPQFLLLDLIDKCGALRMNKIAKELNVSLPAATGLIDRLVAMAMVERTSDARDRRVVSVFLTKKGKKTIEQIRTKRRQAIGDIFSKLTAGERKDYLFIMRKVVRIMNRPKK
ncbi:MAG: MarR family transcriptional regulator [Candidatus Omnitrophica bacterium]|nr:MarR family transcriptional regulator [Candidatus Omnitrophota bacterium]